MNPQKIGALAVVLIFLATAFGAFAIGFNTENPTTFNNPTSTTHAKQYDHEGLSIISDYTDDEYSINNPTVTDDVGLIVTDKGIIDFDPTDTNVTIYKGNTKTQFMESTPITAILTNCTSSGFNESSTTLTLTVSASFDAVLPETITVTVNNVAYTGYSWNSQSGTYTMPLTDITGNIVITIAALMPTTVVTDSNDNTWTLYNGTVVVSRGSGTGVTQNGAVGTALIRTLFPNTYSTIRTVIYDDTITEIGSAHFYNINTLENIYFSEGNSKINDYAFYGCTGVTNDIYLPDTMIYLGGKAFQANRFSYIDLNSVSYIGTGCFIGCVNLDNVVIPDTVTVLNTYLFQNCYNLKSISLTINATTINISMFNNCGALETITVPEGYTTLSTSCFNGCTSLETVNLPTTLTNISTSCFNGCTSLETITIPSLVTGIGNNAFNGCTSLESIYILKTSGTLTLGNTTAIPTTTYIYVPNSTYQSTLQTRANWSAHADYILVGSPPLQMIFGTYTPTLYATQNTIITEGNVQTITYNYETVATITSLTITYFNSTITLTSDVGTLTMNNVQSIYLINEVLTDSEYYVYSGNIAQQYYANPDTVLTYGTDDNGYVFRGINQKVGTGLVAQSSTHIDTDTASVKKYSANSTPIIITDSPTSQYTVLTKPVTAPNGEMYNKEYLIGGIVLIFVGIAVALAVFRRD